MTRSFRSADLWKTLLPVVFLGPIAALLWAEGHSFGGGGSVVFWSCVAVAFLSFIRFLRFVAANAGWRPLLSAERESEAVTLARGRGRRWSERLTVPVGETLLFERLTERSDLSGRPGDLGFGRGRELLVVHVPGGFRTDEIDVVVASLRSMGIDAKEASRGLVAAYDDAVAILDEKDDSETTHWRGGARSAPDPARTLARGTHRVMGPTSGARASTYLVLRATVLATTLVWLAACLWHRGPGLDGTEDDIVAWFIPMATTAVVVAVIVLALARRVLVSLGIVGTLYVKVSTWDARLVTGWWPPRRRAIRLAPDSTIDFFHYSGGWLSREAKATEGRANRLYLRSFDKGAVVRDGSYPSISLVTYYRPSEESLAAFRSVLRVHGVTLRYRSRAPE